LIGDVPIARQLLTPF